jgi:hypothetical protein
VTSRRFVKWGVLLAAAIAVPAGLLGLRFGYEHAAYEVEQEHTAFEVRRYQPRIVAEVTVDGSDARQASSRGFGILADYIFGNNVAGESIAMTSPVEQQRAEQQQSETVSMTTPVDARSSEDGWTVWFTMPSEYALEQLPRPVDPRVRLREVPSTRMVALRFSGVATPSEFERRRLALVQAAESAGLGVRTAGPSTYSQYDPPWTPGFLRRNEVLLELAN